MPFNFKFRLAEDKKEIEHLVSFLLQQPLSYRNYGAWLEKSRSELIEGYKSAVLAFSEDILVGDLVFQKHKQFPRIRELKNARIHPGLKGRYFAAFMLRQAELENPSEFDAIICDTRSDNLEAISLVRSFGYTELARVPLYDSDFEDFVFVKSFERTPSGLFAPIKKKFAA